MRQKPPATKNVEPPEVKHFENTGVTTITERKVVVDPDGRRRVMRRRKIVQSEETNG